MLCRNEGQAVIVEVEGLHDQGLDFESEVSSVKNINISKQKPGKEQPAKTTEQVPESIHFLKWLHEASRQYHENIEYLSDEDSEISHEIAA